MYIISIEIGWSLWYVGVGGVGCHCVYGGGSGHPNIGVLVVAVDSAQSYQ